MKRFLIIVFIFSSHITFSQNYIEVFDGYNSDYDFDWSGFNQYNIKLIERFESYCKKNNMLTENIGMIENFDDRFADYIKTVDINSDSLLDIIYSGPSGGEPNVVYFFIQTESGFKNAFKAYQGVVKVEWNNGKIDKVFTHDWGCCADYRLFNTVYKANYINDLLSFHEIYQSVEVNGMVKPKKYFDEPINFSIDNPNYNIRFQPLINDTTENSLLGTKGNYIAKLPKSATGTAYGSKLDSTGRVWWYVSINPIFLKNNILTNDKFNYPTHLIGWISSRYVIQIK